MTADTVPEAAQSALRIDAGGDLLDLVLVEDAGPLRIARLGVRGATVDCTAGQPLVEILTVDAGHLAPSPRLTGCAASAGLRHVDHRTLRRDDAVVTTVRLADETGLEAIVHLEVPLGVAAVRARVEVVNRGAARRILRSVTSLAVRIGLGGDAASRPQELVLHSAVSEWLGESRWSSRPLRERLADLHPAGHPGFDWKGAAAVTSGAGTWSTGRALPVGVLVRTPGGSGSAIAWQIEHNADWRWDLGENAAVCYLALSGPTDADHQWLLPLGSGESFTTVPVTIAVGDGLHGAVAALTAARRTARRPHPDTAERPVVFNDYMNTLSGDPTTAKLLPLIDAAAEVGAGVFCIDAGWYDDSGDWWPSVGEWQPSTARFPDGGLRAVLDRIRDRGMTPGLWLEPEVIGVRSPAAEALPHDAFLQRRGERVVEGGRYHLDLRHPAARAHLDAVVDRVVGDWGVGYLKLDYNIDPGAGTDLGGTSPGAGLLEHSRSHLAWLDAVLDRHPHLVLENCASGAMRADGAMLSRLQLQSTSDQQDPQGYPPIAAAAPLLMPPEQAGNWAYPQPEMTDEGIAFALCTTLLGRGYLSGHLDRMTPAQRAIVAEAVAAHRGLRDLIGRGAPGWPLGIDQWTARWVALTVGTADDRALTLWRREDAPPAIDVPLPDLRGAALSVSTVFPTRIAPWRFDWRPDDGILRVQADGDEPAARTLRLLRR